MTSSPDLPLVVDLDGTLITIDTFQEACVQLLREQPHKFLLLPFWMLRGRAYAKKRVHSIVEKPVDMLPSHELFLEFLKAEHARGRTLVLATASDESIAKKIAKKFGIFSDVLASDGGTNLKSKKKAALLLSKYGEKKFDYAGNSSADLAVWKHARKAIIVSPSPGLVRRAHRIADVSEVFTNQATWLQALIKAIRPHQIVKNTLIFVPLLSSHLFTEPALLLRCVVAFISFSACTSAVYLFNDLLDLDHDRQHLTKKHRPMASGSLPLNLGVFAALVLFILGVAIAAYLPSDFGWVLAFYIVFTSLYSAFLKQVPMIDVLTLSLLYVTRIVAGNAATGIVLSFWLLLFAAFFFFSLALMKRYSELLAVGASGGTGVAGRGYIVRDAPLVLSLGTASGLASILVLGLYVESQSVTLLYKYPYALWLECILMLFWISRHWFISHRGDMHEDPIIFTVRDPASYVIGFLVAIVAVIAT